MICCLPTHFVSGKNDLMSFFYVLRKFVWTTVLLPVYGGNVLKTLIKFRYLRLEYVSDRSVGFLLIWICEWVLLMRTHYNFFLDCKMFSYGFPEIWTPALCLRIVGYACGGYYEAFDERKLWSLCRKTLAETYFESALGWKRCCANANLEPLHLCPMNKNDLKSQNSQVWVNRTLYHLIF